MSKTKKITLVQGLAADIDQALYDYDLLIRQAQGNYSSGHCLGNFEAFEEALAKNVVSVGGIRHHDTSCRDNDEWFGGGCPGPTIDGRQKPELSHFYDDVFTATPPDAWGGVHPPCAQPGACPCGENYRQNFGGTSAATPIVCGHFELVFEMWGKPSAAGATTNIFGQSLRTYPDWLHRLQTGPPSADTHRLETPPQADLRRATRPIRIGS